LKGIKILLVVSGVIALGIGLVLLLAPQAFLGTTGMVVDEKMAIVGQAQGSILFGLGVINLLAVRVSDVVGLQAVCAGNLATHLAGLGVNLRALAANAVSSSVKGDAVGHVIFGVAFVACLVVLARRKSSVAA